MQDQQGELHGKYAETDGYRLKAEEMVRSLTAENGLLKLDLTTIKRKGRPMVSEERRKIFHSPENGSEP